MTAPREAIFSALFDLTSSVQWNIGSVMAPKFVGFKERTRRIRLFSDVEAKLQPWLGQAEHSERSTQVTAMPYKRVWSVSWMIYHRAGDQPKATPTTWNNLIVDALEAVLAPKPSDPGFLDKRNTLSGLVHHCFIDGEVFKDPGDIDNQALIVVPVKLLIP